MLDTKAIAELQNAAETAVHNRSATPTADARMASLNGLKAMFNLPGKGCVPSKTKAVIRSNEKCGWAAPSAELLRQLAEALPNDGPYDARDDWVKLGHAFYGAAKAAGIEAEGREAWLKLCSRWHLGGDPVKDAKLYDDKPDSHIGWGYLKAELEKHDPEALQRINQAEARLAFSQEAAAVKTHIAALNISPIAAFDPVNIPPREWLYARSIIARYISVLVAPGGTGKSALILLRLLAIACGRELIKGEAPVSKYPVLMFNAEDDHNEQMRRLAAAKIQHGISDTEMGDRFYMVSGRDFQMPDGKPFQLAREGREGFEPVPGAIDALAELIKNKGIKALALDPLGALHGLPENSNEAINMLLSALRQLMDKTGVAIVLVHHTGKSAAFDMEMADVAASRGASALTDGARIVENLITMPAAFARKHGISEKDRRRFIKVKNVKANQSEFQDEGWLELKSVELNNGKDLWPDGDKVQTIVSGRLPTPAAPSANQLLLVQNAIRNSMCLPRADGQTTEWIGHLVARELQIDIGQPGTVKGKLTEAQRDNRQLVERFIADAINQGYLEITTGKHPTKSKDVDFIKVGRPAMDAQDTTATKETGRSADV